jgi:alpha-tubulin suppressor-like RCC1 family protein
VERQLARQYAGSCSPYDWQVRYQCSGVAVPVVGGDQFISVTAGWGHTCALTRDGEAFCWGENRFGPLGTISTAGTSVPAPVNTSLRFTSLHAGGDHTCGITASGAAYCWGDDRTGQLGLGTPATDRCSLNAPCSRAPAPVAGALRFRDLIAMGNFTCGLTTTGTIYCWGESVGGIDLYSNAPVLQANGRTFEALVVTAGAICGKTGSGGLSCWRFNKNGEFGNGSTDALLAPAPVDAAGGRVFQTYSGASGAICALDTAGVAWCWGVLGGFDGVVQYGATPTAVSTSLRFSQLGPSAAASSKCALTSEGRAYCWGEGVWGQLGDDLSTSSAAPVRVRVRP